MALQTKRARPATVAEVQGMRTPGRHSIGDSLLLAVSSSGSRSWIARIRDHDGRRRDIGLGPFADLTLAEAREKARALRKAGREGVPILTRSERRKVARKVPTFRECATRVHGERKGVWRNGKHVDQWLSTLELYVFPAIGDLAVDKVGVPQAIDVLSPIWQTIPETARRVRQRIIAVVDWAHARDYRTTQVSAKALGLGLGPQRAVKGHFAALPYAEVPAVVAKLRSHETIGNLALELLILTAARSGEARGAAIDEIDMVARTWTIPPERMKAGKEHVIPLADRAFEIVERARELSTSVELILPGLKGKVMSDAALSKALRVAGIPPSRGVVHGFRSSFRDWVSEETRFPGDVAEAALAHMIRDKTEAAYKRGTLLAKRREMMAAWDRYCAGETAQAIRLAVK